MNMNTFTSIRNNNRKLQQSGVEALGGMYVLINTFTVIKTKHLVTNPNKTYKANPQDLTTGTVYLHI